MLTENDIYFEPFETGRAGFHGSDVKDIRTETVICEMYERETSILAPIITCFIKHLKKTPENLALIAAHGFIPEDSESANYVNIRWDGFDSLQEVLKFEDERRKLCASS